MRPGLVRPRVNDDVYRVVIKDTLVVIKIDLPGKFSRASMALSVQSFRSQKHEVEHGKHGVPTCESQRYRYPSTYANLLQEF